MTTHHDKEKQMTDAEHVHFVTVEHGRIGEDGAPEPGYTSIRFECRASADAKCRNYPDCGCDNWYIDPDTGQHPHPPQQQPECWLKSWFDAGYDVAMYVDTNGDVADFEHNVPAGSGPIEHEFDDGITWSWVPADEADTLAETAARITEARRRGEA